MNYIAITVDVESDSAAFADPERNTFQGVIDGLPRLTNFFLDQGYPVTLFVSCDVLHELDVEFIVRPDIEIASHGYKHTYPPYYLKTLPLQELRRNLEESKFTLSKTFKTNVVGFRAHGLMVTSSIINEISEYYLHACVYVSQVVNSNIMRIVELTVTRALTTPFQDEDVYACITSLPLINI